MQTIGNHVGTNGKQVEALETYVETTGHTRKTIETPVETTESASRNK